MSFIGTNGAGFVCAGRDGKIYIRQIGQDQKKIPLNLFKNHKFGEEYQISGVYYENGTESFKYGDNSRNILWLDQDNIFITDEEQVENIYNAVKGLTMNSFEGTSRIDPTMDIGDFLVIDGKPVVYQGDMSFNGRFMIDIKSKINIKNKQETTTRKRSQKNINKKLQSQIDEEKLEIKQLAQEQTDTSKKLTEHEQSINGIKDSVSSVETEVSSLTKGTIVSVDVEYALGTSTEVAPTEDWSTKAPAWENGKYMWQRTVTTYADKTQETSEATCISGANGQNGKDGTNGTNGKDGTNGKNGENGEDGIGVKEIEEEYYLSTSDKDQVNGSWKNTQDTWETGKYIWTRSKITWTDGNITYTTPVLATGLNKANEIASDANSTANTANQNAQDAQNKAQEVAGRVETTVEKVSDMEQSIEGFKRNVSEIEEKVTTVENKANTAQSTAEGVSKNLVDNYYTITQTDTKIEEKAGIITSEVSKTVSTAKQEAIDTANDNADEKLKKYTETEKLGTAIEQNYEHVKIAWNQISEFIQMMIINNNASLAILDENKNIIMALDKTGQDFYETGKKFGEMGTEKDETDKYIAFSVDGEYDTSINSGMAWGVKTKSDNKFWPILYIKNFIMPPKNSDGCRGELVLDNCNLLLGSVGAGVSTGTVRMFGDPTYGIIYFEDVNTGEIILSIAPAFNGNYPSISILNDAIQFYRNMANSNSFKIGNDDENYCLFTDTGNGTVTHLNCQTIYAFKKITAYEEMETNIITANRIKDATKNIATYCIISTNESDPTVENIDLVNQYSSDRYLKITAKYGGKAYGVNLWESDKKLKKDIKESHESALNVIKKIKHREFTWKDSNKKQKIGYIAQEMEQINKDFVIKVPQQDETVNYQIDATSIIPYLSKAIQEQQDEIEELKKMDRENKKTIQKLLKRVENLEKGGIK